MITNEVRTFRALAAQGRWDELLGIYRRTRAATAALNGERAAAGASASLGHEIAFAAPAPIAAKLFDPAAGPGASAGEGDGRVGPLWEVLATRHPWGLLAPLLRAEPVRTLIAHTRVLLGEDLTGALPPRSSWAPLSGPRTSSSASGFTRPAAPLAPPLALRPWEQAGWEPGSRVTGYGPGGTAATPLFSLPDSREDLGPVVLPARGVALPGAEQPATLALRGLSGWLTARCLRGTAPDAAALLAPDTQVGPVGTPATGGYLPFAAAYPALVRAASGAGAHGVPGGAARGRLAVWRVLAAMVDPSGRCPAAEVDALVARMRCFTWCDPADEVFHLHLALEDPATGLAWAVSGSDYD